MSEREQFEAWWREGRVPPGMIATSDVPRPKEPWMPDYTNPLVVWALAAWQASRAVALKELLAFLAANPERESALLRQFMDTQMRVGGCK